MDFDLGKRVAHVRDALAWRIRRALGEQHVDRVIETAALGWRRMLRRPVYIGVTGSAGKTTVKLLMLGMLARKGRGIGSAYNRPTDIARTILRLRPSHAFCIGELSEGRPGEMDQELDLLQPSLGVVTVVRDDHWSSYGSRDAIAAEIGKLVAALPATGTAVLNADDERVIAMAARCSARVLSYGLSATAELRAEDVDSAWPDRLQLTLVRGAERVRLRTQLCGAHWVPSVLGAVGGGLAVGLSLAECADGIARVAPIAGRMQPVTTPDGVTFIRDDFKAPLWTVDAALEFVKGARAGRKIVVIGEVSDIGSKKGRGYARIARRAQEIADLSLFVGPWATSALAARKSGTEEGLRAFTRVRDAAAYVNSVTRAGDLVLLKGTHTQDHLCRIIMVRSAEVACWRDDCRRRLFCGECPDRNRPSGAPAASNGVSIPGAAPRVPQPALRTIDPDEQLIVGLGNPDAGRAGSPHNIGHDVVDRLAAVLGLAWDATPEAWVARGSVQGRRVCLVKIRSSMNRIGEGLKRLSESMAFGPEQCILVYDDLDLPMGAVRTRLSGGAGGHRGVASVLEAFRTDAFRRVKVGVGRPGAKRDLAEYLLTALDAEDRAVVDRGIASARARAVEMVAACPRAESLAESGRA